MRSIRFARAARLLAAAPLLAASADSGEIVIDLAPFTPGSIGGEVLGLGTAQGEVVEARLDVTYEVTDTGPWSMSISFLGFPQGGAVGFSSTLEGWSGTGTFEKTIVTDALNGTLAPLPGSPFWSWLMTWSGGTPVPLPDGGFQLLPVEGTFTELSLTLTLASCPGGDPARPWTDLGGALAWSGGTATLTGEGSLCPGEPGTLRLEGAPPGGASSLVIGGRPALVPLLGGLLVPSPDAILAPLPVDASGASELPFAWPPGVPSGFTLYAQHWFLDPVTATFGASNGVEGLAP